MNLFFFELNQSVSDPGIEPTLVYETKHEATALPTLPLELYHITYFSITPGTPVFTPYTSVRRRYSPKDW